MRSLALFAIVLAGCGGSTSNDTSTTDTASPSTTSTTSTSTTTTSTTTTTPAGGDYVVWATTLSDVLRFDFGTNSVVAYGQFATVGLGGNGAWWYANWQATIPSIAGPDGVAYDALGDVKFMLNGTYVYESGGATWRANIDGSGVEDYPLPAAFSTLHYNLDGNGLIGTAYQNQAHVLDMTTNPPTEVFSGALSSEFVGMAMSTDGTLFVNDYSYNQVSVIDATGVLTVIPWSSLDFGSPDLYLNGFAGPGPTPDTIRVVAEQGFANYAIGTLSVDGTLVLDTVAVDNGLAGVPGRNTFDGRFYAGVNTDMGDPGVTLVDLTTGSTASIADDRVIGGVAVLVPWAGVPQ